MGTQKPRHARLTVWPTISGPRGITKPRGSRLTLVARFLPTFKHGVTVMLRNARLMVWPTGSGPPRGPALGTLRGQAATLISLLKPALGTFRGQTATLISLLKPALGTFR